MKKQSVISVLILVFLLCVGVVVYLEQFDYDEKQFHPRVIQSGITQGKSEAPDLAGTAPEAFRAMSDPEVFDSASLSDKINGKADVYLESGFVRLIAGRFVHETDPREWFECFVYDMSGARNAFAVYSVQRREEVRPADFADFAYLTENAVFFVCGRYYIEIIGAKPGAPLLAAMTEMAEKLIRAYPGPVADLPETKLLPKEGLDGRSLRLILKNAFGYETFDAIFTGTYGVDGQRITAFLSIRKTVAEAQSLAAGYARFLADMAGEASVEQNTAVPGLEIIDVMGEYEFIFSQKNVLAGIHGALDRKAALQVADAIYRHLNKIDD